MNDISLIPTFISNSIIMKKVVSLIVLCFINLSMFAQTMKADSLIQLLNKQTTDTGRIRALIRIGSLLDFNMSKSDSASNYLQNAVDISKKTGNKILEAEAVYYLASNLVHSANYPRALLLSLENLKKLEQLKLDENIRPQTGKGLDLIFYQTRLLVFIYSNIGDYKKQLEYVKKMQSNYQSLPKDTGVDNSALTIYYNLANAYDNLEMPDSSFYYSKLLYDEVSKTNEVQWLALACKALGNYYYKQNKMDSAMVLFRKSIPAALKSNRMDVVVSSELSIGSLFQKMNMQDSAHFYTRQALKRLSTFNSPKNLLEAYQQLAQLYSENRQYDSAYNYINNFVILKDSLLDQTKITEAQNFVFNQTLQEQQVEQAIKESRQKAVTKIKFYALAGVIAFILLATFFLLRNLRNKRVANILLTEQKEAIQNSLSALKEAQTQLIQSEKMASLGELTAGIAHEIQNPLNFVNNFSEVSNELIDEMNAELDKGDITEAKAIAVDVKLNLEKINHHGKRADAIVKSMLQHSQSSKGVKEPTDINALCDEYLRLSYHGLRAKDKSFNATIKTDFDETIGNINIVPQEIGRVILNLLTNAFYAASLPPLASGGFKDPNYKHEPIVTIKTSKPLPSPNNPGQPAGKGAEVLISIKDNGPGIPQNIIDKIFQPFFTTKPTGQGTGLGLSLSYDIVKAHGGELKVETLSADAAAGAGNEAQGSVFIIQLPVSGNI